MTYEETCRNIIREYRTKNLAAKQRAEERRRELDEKYPDIAKIDEALLDTGLKILRAALEGPDGLDERIKKLQSDNERLLFDRARLLESKGYPSDYDDVHYDCPVCSDTGYANDGKMCRCMKKALAEAGLECSGVKKLVEKQNFSTFDLRYYTGRLLRMLGEYQLYDVKVWIPQAAALADHKEMVEVTHRLNERRQKLRARIENSANIVREQMEDINKFTNELQPDIAAHVKEIMNSVDKLGVAR